jgi:hypothetical protein
MRPMMSATPTPGDLLAEEEIRRRRAGRSRRDRAAVAVRAASRDRHQRPGGDGRPSARPR